MVKPNEVQPQEKVVIADEANEDIIYAIEILDNKFGKINFSINERIQDLIGFKAIVSKKMLGFIKERNDLNEFFSSFAT
jgi:hypothetical protein